jgi:NADH:ubiquinone oxidoreductase subunit K
MNIILGGLSVDMIVVILLFLLGFYCILRTKNIIRMIIGIEIMARAATLSFIYSGYTHGNTSICQALVITVIVVEVVVSATALALIMNIYKLGSTLNTDKLTKLKG